MSLPYKKGGSPCDIKASDLNNACNDNKQLNQGTYSSPIQQPFFQRDSDNCIRMINRTGRVLVNGEIVGIGALPEIVTPTDLGHFLNNPYAFAEDYSKAVHGCCFGIVSNGAIQNCEITVCLCGVTPALVDIKCATDGFVSPAEGTSVLKSGVTGCAKIESRVTKLGEQLAFIKFGANNSTPESGIDFCEKISGEESEGSCDSNETNSDTYLLRNSIHCAVTNQAISAGSSGGVTVTQFGITRTAKNVGPGDAPAGAEIIVFLDNQCQWKFAYPCCDDSCDSSDDPSGSDCVLCGDPIRVEVAGVTKTFFLTGEAVDGCVIYEQMGGDCCYVLHDCGFGCDLAPPDEQDRYILLGLLCCPKPGGKVDFVLSVDAVCSDGPPVESDSENSDSVLDCAVVVSNGRGSGSVELTCSNKSKSGVVVVNETGELGASGTCEIPFTVTVL